MWNSLQSLLPRAANKYNMTKTLKAIDICREYRRLAPRLLPGEPLIYTNALSYDKRTLIITAVNSAWAEQLQRNKHRIAEEINVKYGEETVNKIIIRIASKPEDEVWMQ
jgi:hypothetical protein